MPATTEDKNVEARSDDELYDILLHTDPAHSHARYSAARDELVRRQGSTIQGRSLDDYFERARRRRPTAERSRFKRRLVVALALWGLAMLIVRAALYLRTHL